LQVLCVSCLQNHGDNQQGAQGSRADCDSWENPKKHRIEKAGGGAGMTAIKKATALLYFVAMAVWFGILVGMFLTGG
jgi:hypothetical protein